MKKSPFWRTGIVLLVLVGLGSWALFYESKRPTKDERDKEKAKVLSVDRAKVSSLEIAKKGGDTIRLVRDGSDWRLEAPVAAAADGSTLESLLTTLESLRSDAEVSATGELSVDYGLDAPRFVISITSEGGAPPVKLEIGEKVPAESSLYARLAGAPRVFTIASYIEASFDKKPFDFRDRDLLKVRRDAIRTLEIQGPEGRYALARDDKGEWAFTAPLSARAGRWAVDSLLGTLEALRIESIAADDAGDPKPFGLSSPSRLVKVGLADGNTKTLEIGSETPEKKWNARLAGSTFVVLIPEALITDLKKGMGELRAKRLLDVAPYEVDSFDVEADGKKSAYSKTKEKDKDGLEASKWKRTAPDAKDLETTKIEEALFKLGGIDALEFVDAPKGLETYGLQAPVLRLSLRSAGKADVLLEIGRKDAFSWARRSGEVSILKLDNTKVDELVKGLTGL
jgi:hypothetical protein